MTSAGRTSVCDDLTIDTVIFCREFGLFIFTDVWPIGSE
jgi:hypothetical protein